MPVDEVEVYRVLTSKSRLEIFRLLYGGPKGIREIADKLSLGMFTVRYHMKALESVGLIERYEIKGRRGKPKAYYKVSEHPPLLTFPKREYQKFSDDMIQTFQRTLGEEQFKKAMWEMGHRNGANVLTSLAAEHGIGDWTVENYKELFVNRTLAESVGEPEIVEESADRLVYRVFSCPFKELAEKYPGYVCSTLEEGMRDGQMEATKGKLVIENVACLADGERYCEFEVHSV
ncbi:MAG TPA: helix-turn-helix domain-containing protein [Conexivisphaerales archaeon]|nr:helix-turn-helix domain-containing protein [Conexivisphaerales archaeon]